ncbi:MAG TPA: hypothetical protein VLE72_04590 [Candidatus Saccharimonadales bacterium]|nr:hypothetical protein [Candidatus Saccharimonadales bacterium]
MNRGLAAFIGWVIFVGVWVLTWPDTVLAKEAAIINLMLISHAIYAVWFALRQVDADAKLPWLWMAAGGIFSASLWLTSTNLLYNSAALSGVFLAGILFHSDLVKHQLSPSMNGLYHYKIRLEQGILLAIWSLYLIMGILSPYQVWILGLGIAGILTINYIIVFKHQIYRRYR